ncbi:MAG TPA: hypothetical protein VFI39_11525 [Gemmatimonadales bacterium]|nr:hypothetical protein [Gemmatimonadales bacterium]
MTEQRTVRGLATIALLKALYDAGKDHIDMFVPFVRDAIPRMLAPTFTPAELQLDITAHHGLTIPEHTVETILSRLTKKRLVVKEHGHFQATGLANPSSDILSRRVYAEQAITSLASRLREYGREAGLPINTNDQAINLLLIFVGANQPDLLLNHFEAATSAVPDGLTRAESRTVARFIKDVALEDPQLKVALQEVIAGLVLQNALLLRDISDASRRFDDLLVALDSNFLLGALGFAGPNTERSFRESLDILKECGVRLDVFEQTVDEMVRILTMYEYKLATHAGRESLHPSDITRHLLTSGATPADIREAIALLPHQLRQLGLRARTTPNRDPRYTLDESTLSEALRRPAETATTPRVQHDVDAVAAVLTLRAGHPATSLENATALFATTNSYVVKTIRDWFLAAGELGVAPAVHHRALTNAAWLKKPASAQRLVLHELVTLCAAALAPSRRLWDSFLAHLKHLEITGTITSDEAAILVASELTDRILSECDEETLEEDSMLAIRTRVLEGFRAEAMLVADAATSRATSLEEQHRRLVLVQYGRADWICRVLSFFPVAALASAYVIGTIAIFPGRWDSIPRGWAGAARVAVVVMGLIGGVALYNGFNLRDTRLALEAWLRPRVRRRMLGTSVVF